MHALDQVPATATSILGSCVATLSIINMADAYDDPRFDQSYDSKTGYRTRSLLTVPIVDKKDNKCLGCLQCLNKHADDEFGLNSAFSDDDVNLIIAFSAVLAVTLQQRDAITAGEQRVEDKLMEVSAKAKSRREASNGQISP